MAAAGPVGCKADAELQQRCIEVSTPRRPAPPRLPHRQRAGGLTDVARREERGLEASAVGSDVRAVAALIAAGVDGGERAVACGIRVGGAAAVPKAVGVDTDPNGGAVEGAALRVRGGAEGRVGAHCVEVRAAAPTPPEHRRGGVGGGEVDAVPAAVGEQRERELAQHGGEVVVDLPRHELGEERALLPVAAGGARGAVVLQGSAGEGGAIKVGAGHGGHGGGDDVLEAGLCDDGGRGHGIRVCLLAKWWEGGAVIFGAAARAGAARGSWQARLISEKAVKNGGESQDVYQLVQHYSLEISFWPLGISRIQETKINIPDNRPILLIQIARACIC